MIEKCLGQHSILRNGCHQGEKGLTCLTVLWRKRNVKRPVTIFVYMGNFAFLAVGNGVRRRNRGMDHIGVDNTFVYGRCNLDDTTVSGGILPESGLQSLGKVQLYLACYIRLNVGTENTYFSRFGVRELACLSVWREVPPSRRPLSFPLRQLSFDPDGFVCV